MIIKFLFALGLILQLTAQLMFSIDKKVLNLYEPIDFIHWSLLLGMALVIPYILKFSSGLYRAIGAPIAMIGALANIGMCSIDFVLWSLRDDLSTSRTVFQAINGEPSIWLVFFIVGPAFLFVGLIIQLLRYLSEFKLITGITIVGGILVGLGGLLFPEIRALYLLGYAIFSFGLIYLAFTKKITE